MRVGMLHCTCWHATLYVLAIMALLCHACGRGFEQQDIEELRASPAEWKSSEFRSVAFCAVIMVIKERALTGA